MNLFIVIAFGSALSISVMYSLIKGKDSRTKAIYNKSFFTVIVLSIFSALLLTPYHNYNPNLYSGGYGVLFILSIVVGCIALVGYLLSSNYE
ncbi:hypothetical protein N780_05135 [Pontibacillus chungwhensis BH030062]|uniref:Uncharacterized protein n=1 Tax=Pontibacillus chungwhensis BH030062 TaxID=1385513 RepID=A0A0A2UQ48_9BACI|nr:hypothetical protein [Pontibacillus chungwhensis]KGP90392.1 hypothetical protein N780_05135 [Pontibacillus chungwhensis BH030062]